MMKRHTQCSHRASKSLIFRDLDTIWLCCKEKDKVDLRETIRYGQEPKTKDILVWAYSKLTLDTFQLQMQFVKSVNEFICRLRTGGRRSGVCVVPIQKNVVRACMSPGDVRYMNENRQTQELHLWRFGPFPCAKQLSEMYRCFWSGTVKLELVP